MIERVQDEVILSEPTTAHEEHVFWSNAILNWTYEYDSTDDGPECEVITRILVNHPPYAPGTEKTAIAFSRSLEVAAQGIFGKSLSKLTTNEEATVRDRVARYYAGWGEPLA